MLRPTPPIWRSLASLRYSLGLGIRMNRFVQNENVVQLRKLIAIRRRRSIYRLGPISIAITAAGRGRGGAKEAAGWLVPYLRARRKSDVPKNINQTAFNPKEFLAKVGDGKTTERLSLSFARMRSSLRRETRLTPSSIFKKVG